MLRARSTSLLLALLGVCALESPRVRAADAGPRPIEERVESPDAGPTDVAVDRADAGPAGDAGPVAALTVKARIEPALVPFGERFDLVIEVIRDRGAPLALPASIPETEACPRAGEPRTQVEELEAPSAAGAAPAARVREVLRIPYLALDTDELKTPALVLTAKDGSTLDVPALDVRVQVPSAAEMNAGPDGGVLLGPDGGPLDPGTVALEPAAGAIAYPVPDERPWVALGTLGLTGLAILIARFVQKRLRRHAPAASAAPPPPPRPAHEVALERLDALLAAGLLQKAETALFVERLMDEVLRDYIAARFRLNAEARTTRELVKELLSITVAGLDVSLVDELLKDADLVKFAKATIPEERAHAMATRVRTFIEGTADRTPTRDAAHEDGAA